MALYTTGQLDWVSELGTPAEVVVDAARFAATAIRDETILTVKVHLNHEWYHRVEFIGEHDDIFAVLYLYWTQGGETDVAFIAEQVQPVSL